MPGLSDLPKGQSYKGLATYLSDMKLIRPGVYQDLMSKPGQDGIDAIQKMLETEMKQAQATAGESRILPDWLPDMIRPDTEIKAQKAEENRWSSLLAARQGLESFKTELASIERNRSTVEEARNHMPETGIHLVKSDPAPSTPETVPVATEKSDQKTEASVKTAPPGENEKTSVDFSLGSKDNFGADAKLVEAFKKDLEGSKYYHAGEPKAYEKALQRQMNAEANTNLVVDGDIGPLTRTAFRQQMGIENPTGDPISTSELAVIQKATQEPVAVTSSAPGGTFKQNAFTHVHLIDSIMSGTTQTARSNFADLKIFNSQLPGPLPVPAASTVDLSLANPISTGSTATQTGAHNATGAKTAADKIVARNFGSAPATPFSIKPV